MAIYTALPQSTNRSWNSLAIVNGKLYGSVETGGSAYIYEIDKVTGAETLKKTATGLNYRGIGNYKDTLAEYRDWETDRKSTRLNSSHSAKSRMPSSA